MPKLSFRIPSQTETARSSGDSKHLLWISVVGVVAVVAIVLIVLMLNRTLTGAVTDAIPNVCGSNALIVDNPWYIDQLERLHYQCLANQAAPIYCCYKR